MYEVINRISGKRVGKVQQTERTASNLRDRLDGKAHAHIHYYRRVVETDRHILIDPSSGATEVESDLEMAIRHAKQSVKRAEMWF